MRRVDHSERREGVLAWINTCLSWLSGAPSINRTWLSVRMPFTTGGGDEEEEEATEEEEEEEEEEEREEVEEEAKGGVSKTCSAMRAGRDAERRTSRGGEAMWVPSVFAKR